MGTLVARVSAQYRCFRDIECMNLVWTDLGCETDHAFPCTGHADAVVILRERFHLQQPWRPPESLPLIAEDLTAYRITLSRKPVRCWWRCVSWSLSKRLGKW